jgi:hypothetical protein
MRNRSSLQRSYPARHLSLGFPITLEKENRLFGNPSVKSKIQSLRAE